MDIPIATTLVIIEMYICSAVLFVMRTTLR